MMIIKLKTIERTFSAGDTSYKKDIFNYLFDNFNFFYKIKNKNIYVSYNTTQ